MPGQDRTTAGSTVRIAILGSGYVGLVSGACFADFGHDVVCVDVDGTRTQALSRGEVPFFEPGLRELVETNLRGGRLSFTTLLDAAMEDAEAVFIAVGTPSRRFDGHAELAHVFDAARDVARRIKSFCVVVTKSTVPVGTGDEIERIIREENPAAVFAVASNPEFLREGAAIRDFKFPDRIVVGTDDERAREVIGRVYRPLFINRSPVIFTDRRTAELIKYAANAFLATKITFINEIADLCEKTGTDVQQVARGIGLDNRIGDKFLHAGPGFGGSCFPKDTIALARTANEHGVSLRIVETVSDVNDKRKRAMGRKVIEACDGSVRGKTIAVLGLSFKPNTDDMRDSPSIPIIQSLVDNGAQVRAFDPEAMNNARKLGLPVEYATNPYECARDTDALVVVTEWEAFRGLDIKRISVLLRTKIIVDLRNIFRPEDMIAAGVRYVSIGRASTGF